jgi:hypothetical protein
MMMKYFIVLLYYLLLVFVQIYIYLNKSLTSRYIVAAVATLIFIFTRLTYCWLLFPMIFYTHSLYY